MLARITRRIPLHIESIDIESDELLLRRYMLEIPVIAVDGREVARAPLNERTLEDILLDVAAQSTK
jgi:hypothetical protein